MRKLLFIIILLCGAVSHIRGQEMRTIFLKAPDSIFPLLSGSYRADLVDYVDARMTARVTNSLDGSSTLEELAPDYMRLAVTASSTMQLKLLPLQGDTVICMLKSVNAEAADSRIYFYDKEWNLLDGRALFVYPSINDFFASAADAAIWSDACDIYLVSLTLSAGDNTLVAEYTMPAYMNAEDARVVAPRLRPVRFRWSGVKFVRE